MSYTDMQYTNPGWTNNAPPSKCIELRRYK